MPVDVPVCDGFAESVSDSLEVGAWLAIDLELRISLLSESRRLPAQMQELGNKLRTLLQIRLQPVDSSKWASNARKFVTVVPLLDLRRKATRFCIGSLYRSSIRYGEFKRETRPNLAI